MIYQVNDARIENETQLRQALIGEAAAHFDTMVVVRNWNAMHEGVYVRGREGLAPNPYLKENTLRTDANETLIRINPAWMTRQISEMTNAEGKYYYRITALDPLNPANGPDAFEREALEFFQAHPDTPYYWKFNGDPAHRSRALDFMGSLKLTKACFSCHHNPEYRVGDVRGGIRISMPAKRYYQTLGHYENESKQMMLIIVSVGLAAFGLITVLLLKLIRHTELLKNFNARLEQKVARRTREMRELNEHLEERIQDEVLKNHRREEYLLAQSRYAAMGEMVGMLAHQWRQPISVIAMSANNLLVDAELGDMTPEALKRELTEIVERTGKLSRLIEQFQGHFEDSGEAMSPICDMADEVLFMMRDALNDRKIEPVRMYDAALYGHRCSRQLLQVFLHLLNNAKEALERSTLTEKRLTLSVLSEEQMIVIRVVNSGPAVQETDLPHIFDPYFSTKSDVQEVGLGLYISRIIVERVLGGSIRLYNTKEGVCAEVQFPREQCTL